MFFNLINLIKLGFLYKKKYIKIKLNKIELNLVKHLIFIKIIKYIKQKNNIYYIYLHYSNQKPIFKNIINLYKISKITFFSLKNLKKISLKKNSILILTTNKGLINNFEAVNKNIGGILLLKLWN